ncbi:MAG: hypothetical protein CTY29_01210 [Methylobacter sp.]|nr:MAG: hypothetical protein CTY29_01210 [Methylobacter sp.]
MKIFGNMLIMLLGLSAASVYACQVDNDCALGSRCVRTAGQLNGVCQGGNNPGNQNDKNPYRTPGDFTGKKGNTCTLNTDCGISGKCVKGNNYTGHCQ